MNKLNATKMKVESHNRLDERAKDMKEDLTKKVKIVEQVHSQKDKASEAVKDN